MVHSTPCWPFVSYPHSVSNHILAYLRSLPATIDHLTSFPHSVQLHAFISRRDDAEVEAALSALDDELDQTEDALTEWSHQSSATPSSYLSGSASSPSFTSTSSIYIPFTNTLGDARILSTITERTENPSSRPTSYPRVPQSTPILSRQTRRIHWPLRAS